MGTMPLSHLRVIDLGEGVSAPFCAKLLGSLGADVIKVEKPGTGDGSRRLGPFPGDVPDPESSGMFLYLNTDKLGVTLDIETLTGLSILKALLKDSDILIENRRPGEMERLGLGYDSLKALNPKLILVSITSFGLTGPYKDYKATDLISFHTGGLGYITPRPGAGEPDEGPLRVRGHFADFLAGLDAAAGTMCALNERDRSGLGQHLDISEQESVAVSVAVNMAFANYEGRLRDRKTPTDYQPVTSMRCKDGYVDIQCNTEDQWQRMVEVMGNPEWAKDKDFSDRFARYRNWRRLEPLISEWLMQRGKQEFYREAEAKRVPAAPMNTIEDLVNSEHLAARDFFVEVEQPGVGAMKFPGPLLRLSGTPPRVSRPAPRLGEHNEMVFCDRLGYSRQDLVKMRQSRIL